MYKSKDITYEEGGYFVLMVLKGYVAYREGCTHAVRCAQIGYQGPGRAEAGKILVEFP